MTTGERKAIKAFLAVLSDSDFITNKKFNNPNE
jgi:hypothetical protein